MINLGSLGAAFWVFTPLSAPPPGGDDTLGMKLIRPLYSREK